MKREKTYSVQSVVESAGVAHQLAGLIATPGGCFRGATVAAARHGRIVNFVLLLEASFVEVE